MQHPSSSAANANQELTIESAIQSAASGMNSNLVEDIDYAQHLNVDADGDGNVEMAHRDDRGGLGANHDRNQNRNDQQHHHPGMGMTGNGRMDQDAQELDAQGDEEIGAQSHRQLDRDGNPIQLDQHSHPQFQADDNGNHSIHNGNQIQPFNDDQQQTEGMQDDPLIHHLNHQPQNDNHQPQDPPQEPSFADPRHFQTDQDLDPKLKEPLINLDHVKDSSEKISTYRSNPETYHLVEKFVGMNPENFDKLLGILDGHHLFSSSRQGIEKQLAVYLYSKTWKASYKQISKCCGCSMATVAVYKERVEEVMNQRKNTILREVRSKLWHHYPNLQDEELELSESEDKIKVPAELNSAQQGIIQSGHRVIKDGGRIIIQEKDVSPNQENGNQQRMTDPLNLMSFRILVDSEGKEVDLPNFNRLLEGRLEDENDVVELYMKIKARNPPSFSEKDVIKEWKRIKKVQRARDRNERYMTETNRLLKEQNSYKQPKKNRKKRKDANQTQAKKEVENDAAGDADLDAEGDTSMMDQINMMDWNGNGNGNQGTDSSSAVASSSTNTLNTSTHNQSGRSTSTSKQYSTNKSNKKSRNSTVASDFAHQNLRSSNQTKKGGRSNLTGGARNSTRDSDDESYVSLNGSLNGDEEFSTRPRNGSRIDYNTSSSTSTKVRRSNRKNKNRMSLNENAIESSLGYDDDDEEIDGDGDLDAEGEDDFGWSLDIDENSEELKLDEDQKEIEKKKIMKEIFGEGEGNHENGNGNGNAGGEDVEMNQQQIDSNDNGNPTFKAQNLLIQSIEEERELKKTFEKDYQDEIKKIKLDFENRLKEKLKFVRNRIKVVREFCAGNENEGGDVGSSNEGKAKGKGKEKADQSFDAGDHQDNEKNSNQESEASNKRKIDEIVEGNQDQAQGEEMIHEDQEGSNKRTRIHELQGRSQLEIDAHAILASQITQNHEMN